MRPFHFGSAKRRLYGVYHAAAPVAGAARAAVLCYPWGPEYTQAHRAMRQLAVSLTAIGVHVLRFDYFGTGDSDGETDEGDLDGWRGDIEMAIDEAREISGATRVTLIGLRLGAVLALAAADSRAGDIERILLWDPIISGNYLSELDEVAMRTRAMPVVPREGPKGGYEIFGYTIGDRLAQAFEHLEPGALARRLPVPMTLVASGDEDSFDAAMQTIGPDKLEAALHVRARYCWAVDDGVLSTGFVPAEVIGAIVRQLG